MGELWSDTHAAVPVDPELTELERCAGHWGNTTTRSQLRCDTGVVTALANRWRHFRDVVPYVALLALNA